MPPLVSPQGSTDRVGPLYYRAIANIERLMRDDPDKPGEEIQQKEVAFAAGLSETVFSQKKRGVRSHFYEDEFERIAEFFRRRYRRPLIGFPHLEWQMQDAVDRKIGGWRP